MTEAILTRNIIKALNALPRTYAVKIHGGQYQAGLPDVVCCSKGKYYGLEVKLPGKERNLTKLQANTLWQINQAEGTGIMVTTVEQALEAVYGH